jgi:high affinity Mn2+ porin
VSKGRLSLYQSRRQFAFAWGRGFLLGGVSLAALALAGPVAGADGAGGMVRKASSTSPAYYDWTGLYIGINAGYGFGKSRTDAFFSDSEAGMGTPLFAAGTSSKLGGMLFGAQAGYHWQSGIWFIGVETDIAATNQRKTQAHFCSTASCNPTLAGSDAPVGIWRDQKLDWFSTLRGRLGVTVTPNALLYATGGGAVAGISHLGTIFGSSLAPLLDADGNPVLDANGNPINTTTTAGAGFLTHTTKTGWVAGGGVEAHLIGDWTGKIEYLHLDFGRDPINAANLLNATPLAVNLNSHITDDIVRVGLNYRLTPNGVAASASRMIYIAPAEVVWNWTGLYLGINFGYGFGRSQTDALFNDAGRGTSLFAITSSSRFDGLILGAQTGYNWQAGGWLFGVEADIQATSQHAGPTYVCPGAICNAAIANVDSPVTVAHDYKLDWFATVRGRLGAAITPDTVIYGTGGVAFAGIWNVGTVFDSTAVVAPLFDINERTKAGWVAGAGIESHLTGNWTGKIEYLHLDFGSASTATADPLNATPIALGLTTRVTDDILRLGLNYKIGPNATAASDDKSGKSGKSRKTTPAATVWSWTGLYFGGHVGYSRGWVSNTLADAIPAIGPTTSAPTFGSMFGGFQAGYNYLLPSRLLLGVEADASFPNFFDNGLAAGLGTAAGTAVTDQIDYVATLRGRLGYAVGHWLVYATGGYAWSQSRLSETPGLLADQDRVMRTHTGWAAGLGAEVAIAAEWTAKLEYLYYSFGNVAGTFPSGTGYKSSFDLQTVRLGLNRQLDWGNPGSGAIWTSDPQLLALGTWNVHGQLTFIGQGYGQFHSPYFGDNSLFGGGQYKNTTSATAFIGVRPWAGTEIYVNPEFMQGNGLSDTFGLGGFPNGEAQKSGFPIPRMNIGRVFVRQTFGLGGEQETIEDGPNQLAGKQDISRITVTAGKFQVTDLFDNNAYSHDPRTSFLNWTLQCCGAYDWTMDKVGYTWGAAIDFNQKYWAFRVGYFLVPIISNDNRFDTQISKHGEYIAELELRYSLFSQPGKLRLMAWANVANAGSYSEALAEPVDTPNYPDITLTRNTRTNYGFLVNVEQAVTDQLGMFSRVSWNPGRTEILGWTDVNQSFSLGAVLRGNAWGRPYDKIGVAGIINGLSPDARAYFAAGGLGILIGDGALNYRPEKIFEAYYAYSLNKWSVLTFDYQFIADPAYNADRGPVSFYAMRFHAEF